MKRLLLLLSLIACINVAVNAQAIRYVAPNVVGSGDGLSAATAKDFLDSSFWTEIQNLLKTQSVTVKFIAGNYVRAYTEQSLILNGMGHVRYKLVLEGENANTSVFTAPTGYGNKTVMFSLVNCQNIAVRNFYFTGNGSIDYVFRVTSSGTGKISRDILVENCSWEDMRGIIYGSSGTAHPGTSYVTFKNCTFKRIGLNSGSHMIYNAYDSHHISVIDSHFEDCTGDYVRFRDNLDYAIVKGTTFVRNSGFVDYPFIAMPLFNDVNPGDEIFATNYSFTDNTFKNAAIAIQFYSSGHDPVGRNHLLTAAEGTILTTGTNQQKKDLLLNNFKINTDLVRINNNTYNSISKKVVIRSINAYGSVSKGWTGEANISDLFNSSSDLLPWEENYYNLPRWTETGNLKNSIWEYNFEGTSGTVVNDPTGVVKASTPNTENFLPKPGSGEVKILGTAETGVGRAAFTLNGLVDPYLKMVHTSGAGAVPSPAKFIATDFVNASKVMSAHFNIKLENEPTNYQAIWYIVIGKGSNSAINGINSPAISSRNNSTDASEIYTVLRLRKASTGNGSYAVQARWRGTDATNWAWQALSSASIANGVDTKVDLFFNNSESQQEYVFNGVKKNLEAGFYHIYINDVQKGTNATDAPLLRRNIGGATSQYFYTGDLTGIGIMSREGAHSNEKQSDGTTIIYNNSASLTLSNLKIVHLATPTTNPVTLTNFTGSKNANGIALNWKTASEQNNSHFILNRSANGLDFSYLTRVEGNGTTASVNSYSYTDRSPAQGINYYQLEQIDNNGATTVIDKVVDVKYAVSDELFTVSKVSSNQLKAVVLSEKNENVEFYITDVSGKVIYKSTRTLTRGNNEIDVFMPSVQPGVYIAAVKRLAQTNSIKFIW